MNKIKIDRDRLEKEMDDNKIRLNERNNQYQVNLIRNIFFLSIKYLSDDRIY
jgi:hypothetical protein